MKHRDGWKIRQLDHGVLEFTSPSGTVRRDEPSSRVFFSESSDRPPRGVRREERGLAGVPRPVSALAREIERWELRAVREIAWEDAVDPAERIFAAGWDGGPDDDDDARGDLDMAGNSRQDREGNS